ncbi:MAG: hypothetical protein IKP77_02170 [Acholeplasmatales bacterium]|nr:hypothetical protein [Acholeplasmatales bacterium]
MDDNNLIYKKLFRAKPHVFISKNHPLSNKKEITLDELDNYPYLSFEQGNHNSFYFSEEILSTVRRNKNIRVRDRATLFNLLIGLNGYTVSSGVLDEGLNGEDIISVPLNNDDYMDVIAIMHKNVLLSEMGQFYLESINKYCE